MKTTKLVIKLHVLVIFELQVDIIHLNVKGQLMYKSQKRRMPGLILAMDLVSCLLLEIK